MSITFICKAEPDYNWLKTVAKMEPHCFRQWFAKARSIHAAIAKGWDASYAKSEVAVDDVNQANFETAVKHLHTHSGLLMDSEEVEAWTEAGLELKLSQLRGLGGASKDVHNTIYQVSVANVGLMQIQRVEVLEDECTDDLQRWLDRGWRILAVCPPNDARRPSYVVGHFEKGAD